MTRNCEILDKGFLSGNKVSHAVNKTRRRFLPNLQSVHLTSNILSKTFKLKVSTQAIRTINFQGGFDEYLIQTHHRFLTKKARALKKAILLKKNNDD